MIDKPPPTHARGRSAGRRPLTASRTVRALTAVLCALGLSVTAGSPAVADSAHAGGDLQIAQTLGDRDLTFVLRRVTGLPGPLHVDVLTLRDTPAGSLRLRTVATGASRDRAAGAAAGTTTSSASVELGSTPGAYGAALRIDHAGPWELVVDDGSREARIPFVVPDSVLSPPELVVYAGFVTAGGLILVTLFVAVRARRGSWVLVPVGGVVAALATAVTAALLSASLPAPPEPGQEVAATVDNVTDPYAVVRPAARTHSRPPAALTVSSWTARAGEPGTLRLNLADGSTGLPADDLVVHDGALVHLLVIGPTGQIWHLHPIRTEPGTFEVELRLPVAGHYALSAEFARLGGGVQQVRSATGLTVAGRSSDDGDARALPADLVPRGPGTRTVGDVPVRLSAPSPTVGVASILTVQVGDTATLQPWLGMIGHMFVVGPFDKAEATSSTRLGEAAQDAQVWSHVHSMGGEMGTGHDTGGHSAHGTNGSGDAMSDSMSGLIPLDGGSAADQTVAAYGPDVSFVHTFSSPGYYRLWIQTLRDNTLLTSPYLLHVQPATATASATTTGGAE
ncbi:hypothetical protein ACFSUJ_30490 [Streptomyces lusitanus]|uniref:Secreted protein n=1 Tax=Streptomyces lusitanus TaxID=68232 RepID=A0ABU3JNT3_9ACTN|nr:hypothetical protein [Streptomyces lusitanus]